MCIEHAVGHYNLFVAAAQEREEKARLLVLDNMRIGAGVYRDLANNGFNLYPKHVEWFSHHSETWISFEVPSFIYYMRNAKEIIQFLLDYLNIREEYEQMFS